MIDTIIGNEKKTEHNDVSSFDPILDILKKHKENNRNELFCVLYEDKNKQNISNYIRNVRL